MTLPGTMTASIDRYRLLRVLGRGGMGVVYLATDTLLDREVALKVVDRTLLADRGDNLTALFQQEARNLAGLNHPGIVQVFDYSGLYSSRLYLVMEYVPGRDLGEILSQAGRLPEPFVLRLGVATCGVLSYAHRHGIVHQDLKPANMLMMDDGRLKLTDFGISRRVARADAAHESSGGPLQVTGTPAFMAPEQALGRPVDARSDIFSLGATLYTLVSGCQLVEGLGPTETVAAIARGDFPALRTAAPSVSEALDRVVMRALSVAPPERFDDAQSFGAALASIAELPVAEPGAVPRVPPELLPTPPPPEVAGQRDPRRVPTTLSAVPSAVDPLEEPQSHSGLAVEQTVPDEGAPAMSFVAEADSYASLPVLMDRFQLTSKLGTGALGEMWLAHDRMADNQPVALKIFRTTRGASIDEFKAEFRDLSTLNHPHLIKIRDFGTIEGSDARAFYSMDFIDGPNLRRATENASHETIYELLVQVARALSFLHDNTNRPHLSLKPENILLGHSADGRPHVVLTDPGNPTEKLRSIHRGERTCLPYAAPETLAGLSAGPAADLYSFGVIAFELLAGRRPFVERTPETLRSAHLYRAPPDLRQLAPSVPEPIADIVTRLLAKEASERPTGADAWIRAVNQVVMPPYPLETEATRHGRFSSAPWIGRSEALETLLAGLRAALEPGSTANRIWLVSGERGLGKGRLLDELRRTAQLGGAAVLEGLPGSRSARPYAPLIPLVNALTGAASHDPAHRATLARLAGETNEGGADPGDVAELLVGSVRRPTVMLLKKAHLMDRSTIDVVARMSRILSPIGGLDTGGADVPLFVVMTVSEHPGEPGTAEGLEGLPGVHRMTLAPLDADAIASMLRAFFGNQPLPDAQLGALHRVTGGNPGDVQDVLYMMLEAGDLVSDGVTWRLRPGVAVPLPPSVEHALRQRLASLNRDERDVLETICVFGAPVAAKIIDSLGPKAPAAVQSLMDRELLTREMIDDEVCLQFAHDRVREALLRELAPEVREARHRQAAQWLEANRPAEQVVEALATHWSAGGRPERALSFLLEAAARTEKVGDTERTIRWYSEALQMLPRAGLGVLKRLKAEARIRRSLGDARRAAGEPGAAEAEYKRLLAIGEDLEDQQWVCTAVDKLAIAMIDASRFEEALSYARRGREMAVEAKDMRGQAMALRLIGSIRRAMGDSRAGLKALHKALAVAGEGPELADVRARIAVTISYAYADAGQPAEAIGYANWGLEIARGQSLVEMEVSLLINLSMAWFYSTRPDKALAAASEAMTLSAARGLKRYYTLALGNMGDCLRLLGQFEEAERLLKEALKETYHEGAIDRVVARLSELATLSLDRGRPEGALKYLREAWRLLPSCRDQRVWQDVAMTELRMRLWSSEGELAATSASTGELLQEVETRARAQKTPAPRVRALALVATAALDSAPQTALKTALQALELAEQVAAPGLMRQPEVARALIRVLRETGRGDDAQRLAASVREAVQGCAEILDDPAHRDSYLAIPIHRWFAQLPAEA